MGVTVVKLDYAGAAKRVEVRVGDGSSWTALDGEWAGNEPPADVKKEVADRLSEARKLVVKSRRKKAKKAEPEPESEPESDGDAPASAG